MLWGNSSLIDSSVQDFIVLSREEILVLYEETGMTGLYLLEKTPAYELPEKEAVVLAAFDTTLELENAIIRFNRQSSEYQVILEDYGYSGGNAQGAQVRMDAALVSDNPPELLSLKGRDLKKDMEKGLLEDLFPWLEASRVLDREDFLENALEGYTINGKLVGIPKEVYVNGVAGRASQVGDLDSWTMEDVYALTEKYPQMLLLSSGSPRDINTREHLLEDFCSPYYLEEFVDWEKGECSFDSDGFRRLLSWAGEYGKASDENALPRMRIISEPSYVPEDTLLIEDVLSFGQAAVWEVQMGESLRLLGYPTADGNGRVCLDVKAPAGIVAGAKNKDGAWAFLEYFLETETSGGIDYWMPVRISGLENMMEKSIREEEGRIKFSVGLGGEAVPVYGNSRETARQVMASLEEADFSPGNGLEDEIVSIVVEEAEGYYTGNKSLDEVTGIIQNRVKLLLGENR